MSRQIDARLKAFRLHVAKQLTKLAKEIHPDVEIVWSDLPDGLDYRYPGGGSKEHEGF